MQPMDAEQADAWAKLALQLPILTGVVIVAVASYLAVRFVVEQRRQAQLELLELLKQLLRELK